MVPLLQFPTYFAILNYKQYSVGAFMTVSTGPMTVHPRLCAIMHFLLYFEVLIIKITHAGILQAKAILTSEQQRETY